MPKRKLSFLLLLALLNACSASPSIANYFPGQSSELISEYQGSFEALSNSELKLLNESNVVSSNNQFGIELFKDIAQEESGKNIFISPLSAAVALQMTYNGADGETKSEMANALKLGGLSLEELNQLNKLLFRKMKSPAPDIKLELANSLWGDDSRVTFKEQFVENLAQYYDAPAISADFSDPETVNKINQWAADKTNDKITEIIKEIDPNNIAFLINSLYFKADWHEKFEKSQTADRQFTTADGETINHPFRSDFQSYKYYKQEQSYQNGELVPFENQFEIAEIPYGQDKKLSMYLFLPKDMDLFLSELSSENITDWLGKLNNGEGLISFPKFKMSYRKILNQNLNNLGMKQAFTKSANFTEMGESPLGNIYIDYVSQDTFIDVNEEGSEAAAVTTVVASADSSEPSNRFVADRPFIYLIRDNETKANLFMGIVNQPEYS